MLLHTFYSYCSFKVLQEYEISSCELHKFINILTYMYCTQLNDANKVCCISLILLHTVPVAFYKLEVHSTLYILTR